MKRKVRMFRTFFMHSCYLFVLLSERNKFCKKHRLPKNLVNQNQLLACKKGIF